MRFNFLFQIVKYLVCQVLGVTSNQIIKVKWIFFIARILTRFYKCQFRIWNLNQLAKSQPKDSWFGRKIYAIESFDDFEADLLEQMEEKLTNQLNEFVDSNHVTKVDFQM